MGTIVKSIIKINYFYFMTNKISPLKDGDKIVILAPAKSIDSIPVEYAKNYLEKCGFEVLISKNCLGKHHYYSGSETERLIDFQTALDDVNVRAILCARGGYGCVQIVDKIQWASFLRNPKWIIGFSDITVFHQRIQKMELPSIHGTMPLNFENNSREALSTLISALRGEKTMFKIPGDNFNKLGKANGVLVGGNLSIIYSLLGTDDQVDFTDKILFIEDLSEQLYHVDRMFYALSKAGILDQINGLVIGGMTDLKDTEVSIGSTYQEIVLSHFQYKKTPICFNFPAGHINDNRALILGNTVELIVKNSEVILN